MTTTSLRQGRRWLFALALGGVALAACAPGSGTSRAQDTVLRVGFQKYGTLIPLRTRGTLEEQLKSRGWSVQWKEYPAGPQMLEALAAGEIDFGTTGEAPPIIAQAAGAPLVYVGYEPPAPEGEAILVRADSPLKTVADLKGKTVVLNRGSNVHYFLVKALEQAGLQYADVKLTFLPPADGSAAFKSGAADAWAIWDPYLADAEAGTGARRLTGAPSVVSNYHFYLAARPFATAHADVIDVMFNALGQLDEWVKTNPKAVAAQLSPALGLPPPVVEIAVARQAYGARRMDDGVVAAQQKIADTFLALGVIPKVITVADAVLKPHS